METTKLMKSMPPQTLKVFEALANCSLAKKTLQQFTLVGGTALAIHINHRLSEDLDFFKKGYDLKKREIFRFLEENKIHYLTISEPSREQIDLDINGVKITFFASGFDSLEDTNNVRYHNIMIASLKLIAAMKVSTLSFRATFRDYYDLYVLNKEVFSLRELYNIAKEKIPIGAFKLFCQQLLYTKDIEEKSILEHLSPKYTISLEEIRTHFEKELRKELERL